MAIEPKLKKQLDELLLKDLFEVCEHVTKKLERELRTEAEDQDEADEEEAAEHYEAAADAAGGAVQELDGAESHFRSALRELGW